MVVDKENGQPLGGASVFLSNTSVGTTANGQGAFSLSVPEGKYDLIVSSIGFETFNQTIITTNLPEHMTIKLTPKAKELATVIVEPFEKDGWDKWGKFFLDNFIGTSAQSRNCILKNKNVIKFRRSKKTDELTAIALEPLIIENKALGYSIRYQLEDFSYNFKTRYLYYGGYPLFEPMEGSGGRERRWAKARQEVYYGSMMHFMRSLFRNKIAEEHFDIYALKRMPNAEKARVREVNNRRIRTQKNNVSVAEIVQDSSAYYDRILAQEDVIEIIGSKLTGDSIAYAVNNTTAGLDFSDYLLIIYKKGSAPLEYRQQFPKSSTALMSKVTLINGKPIEIQANGSYYMPADFLSLGYWAWSEKVATMLPFDYNERE
ncbi:MAG: carboxypeptidase-like regulatory protein [Flaviaesturariibacter sp.]|nr:carboxypeptidase-like regulatory protein [Flaviaesturariibacter sp.]